MTAKKRNSTGANSPKVVLPSSTINVNTALIVLLASLVVALFLWNPSVASSSTSEKVLKREEVNVYDATVGKDLSVFGPGNPQRLWSGAVNHDEFWQKYWEKKPVHLKGSLFEIGVSEDTVHGLVREMADEEAEQHLKIAKDGFPSMCSSGSSCLEAHLKRGYTMIVDGTEHLLRPIHGETAPNFWEESFSLCDVVI